MKRNRKSNVPGIEVEVTLDLPRRPNAEETNLEAAPRIPRVTRLMALAVKYQGMVDTGELRDYANIARLGYVSRARVTQIMNLANLAPEIQEALLLRCIDLPAERRLRRLTAEVHWPKQRLLWKKLFDTIAVQAPETRGARPWICNASSRDKVEDRQGDGGQRSSTFCFR